jgi:hypothetical protein
VALAAVVQGRQQRWPPLSMTRRQWRPLGAAVHRRQRWSARRQRSTGGGGVHQGQTAMIDEVVAVPSGRGGPLALAVQGRRRLPGPNGSGGLRARRMTAAPGRGDGEGVTVQ